MVNSSNFNILTHLKNSLFSDDAVIKIIYETIINYLYLRQSIQE